MKKKLFLTLLLTLPFLHCLSQVEKVRHLTLTPGIAYLQVKDNGMSPLLYSGAHAAISLGLIKEKINYHTKIQGDFFYGKLTPAIYPERSPSYALSRRSNLSYDYLRKLKMLKENKLVFLLGGSSYTTGSFRNHKLYTNNAVNYDFFTSIAAIGKIYFNLTPEAKKCILTYQLGIPLLSWWLRPSFASSNVDGYLEEYDNNFSAITKSGRFSSINKLWGLNSKFGFEYYLQKKHAIQLGYEWSFYSINSANKIKSAVHLLNAGFMFQF